MVNMEKDGKVIVPMLSVGYVQQIQTHGGLSAIRRSPNVGSFASNWPLEIAFETILIPTYTPLKMYSSTIAVIY